MTTIIEAEERDTTSERPLYGHTSPETAYLVSDYPYGRTVRCRIRYWIEEHATRGFRFVSQTENPRTLVWNKTKASTYCLFAGCMYLDSSGHVQWAGVGEYTNVEQVASFVARFPRAVSTPLRRFVEAKCGFLNELVAGRAFFTINGTRQARTDADKARDAEELTAWRKVRQMIEAVS